MAAKRSVEWSIRATGDIDRIYNYLIEEWSEKEAKEFLDLIDEFVSLISQYPEAFAVSRRKPKCRLELIHKNVPECTSSGIIPFLLSLFSITEPIRFIVE